MKSKVLIFAAVGILLVAGGGIYFLNLAKGKKSPVVSPGGEVPESTPTTAIQASSLSWNDPAGFTFQYPAEGEINKFDSRTPEIKINKHPEDNTNYAHLDLYVNGKDGAVKILAADTKYKSVEEWATKTSKGNQLASGGTETVLGGKAARKVIYTNTNQTIVAAIDEGILFTVELTPDKEGFWQKTFNQVVSSFAFVYPTQAPVSATKESSSQTGSEIIEEEEIIE